MENIERYFKLNRDFAIRTSMLTKASGEWKIREMSSDIIWCETHEVTQEV